MAIFPLTDEQVIAYARGDDSIAEDNHEALYEYYTTCGGEDAMPYGTAKARTGDPYQFIADKLDERAKGRIFTLRFSDAGRVAEEA